VLSNSGDMHLKKTSILKIKKIEINGLLNNDENNFL